MKLVISILWFCASLAATADGQVSSADSFYRMYPREEAFLVTDNSVYAVGESLLFKIFLWDSSDQQQESNIAYVALRDSHGKIVSQRKVMIVGGEGHGSFSLEAVSPGFLSVEVYTRWMLNFDEAPIVKNAVLVGKTTSPLSNRFSSAMITVEGGNLLVGEIQKIAVSPGMFTSDGFTAVLVDSEGIELERDTIRSFYGTIKAQVKKPGAYKVRLCLLNGGECFDKFVQTSTTSTLVLAGQDSATARFKVISDDDAFNGLSLLVMSNQLVAANLPVTSGDLVLKLQNLPQGVLHALLVRDNTILSHRAIYNGNLNETEAGARMSVEGADSATVINLEDGPGLILVRSSDAGLGGYPVRQGVSTSSLGTLMLFQEYTQQSALTQYLTSGQLPIRYYRSTSFRDTKLPLSTRETSLITPYDLVVGGFQNRGRIETTLLAREQYLKIADTYGYEFENMVERVPSDKTYDPHDYPDVKTIGDFMAFNVAANLRPHRLGDKTELTFTYMNMKGIKSTYAGKPAICLDGHLISGVEVLKELPVADVASVDVLFDPQTIVAAGLREFFPYGAVMVYSKEREAPAIKAIIAAHPALFSRTIDWPMQFSVGPTRERRPPFYSVHQWQPSSQLGTIVVPNSKTRRVLTVVNMKLARKRQVAVLQLP